MRNIMMVAAMIVLAGCQGLPTSKPAPVVAQWWSGSGDYFQEVAANPRAPLEDVQHSLIYTNDGAFPH